MPVFLASLLSLCANDLVPMHRYINTSSSSDQQPGLQSHVLFRKGQTGKAKKVSQTESRIVFFLLKRAVSNGDVI